MVYDALIVGGGHNGLTCAFYLARAGYKVRVLERRGIKVRDHRGVPPRFPQLGGQLFGLSAQPKVIADMELARHGLGKVIHPLS